MRYCEIISEDAASDRMQRSKARRILRLVAEKLLDVIPHRGDLKIGRRKGALVDVPILWAALSDLGMPEYDDLAIGYVGIRTGPAAGIIELDKIPHRDCFPNTVRYFISIPYEHFPNDFILLQNVCRQGWQAEKIIHELIHYLDGKRGVPLQGSDPNLEKYYNDPLETNAYYQATVASFDKRPATWFAVPARRWLKNALKMFDLRFLAAQTPENRRRLLKRLYGLWLLRQKPGSGPKSGESVVE